MLESSSTTQKPPRLVLCFAGKRKSGKDFICTRVRDALVRCNISTAIVGVSHPLKEEYARIHSLDAERLKANDEYKEMVRASMVAFGEEKRKKDASYFCRYVSFFLLIDRFNNKNVYLRATSYNFRLAMERVSNAEMPTVVIITDCRRPSDLDYFRQNYTCMLVKVDCSDDVRRSRGYVFTFNVDDAASECALDDFHDWDLRIKNDCTLEELDKQILALIERVKTYTLIYGARCQSTI